LRLVFATNRRDFFENCCWAIHAITMLYLAMCVSFESLEAKG
jgi:hypothetical protein